MVLKVNNLLKIKNLGLNVISNKNSLIIFISENENTEESYSDDLKTSRLDLINLGTFFRVTRWEWLPGPGPGDFVLDFTNEDEAVDFIENYYFGDNPYREILRTYLTNHRKSYNLKDLDSILQELVKTIRKNFGDSEIVLNERGSYCKIPIEKWNIIDSNPENFDIEVSWGFLEYELGQLRDKISKQIDFNSEDIEKIASLLMDLSINFKKRKL